MTTPEPVAGDDDVAAVARMPEEQAREIVDRHRRGSMCVPLKDGDKAVEVYYAELITAIAAALQRERERAEGWRANWQRACHERNAAYDALETQRERESPGETPGHAGALRDALAADKVVDATTHLECSSCRLGAGPKYICARHGAEYDAAMGLYVAALPNQAPASAERSGAATPNSGEAEGSHA